MKMKQLEQNVHFVMFLLLGGHITTNNEPSDLIKNLHHHQQIWRLLKTSQYGDEREL